MYKYRAKENTLSEEMEGILNFTNKICRVSKVTQ